MSTFLTEIRELLVPGLRARHGPLPPLLLAMTLVTGLVDAFSYLLLGHVFVANMTGNVVILGFALVGAPASPSQHRSSPSLRLHWGHSSAAGSDRDSPITAGISSRSPPRSRQFSS